MTIGVFPDEQQQISPGSNTQKPVYGTPPATNPAPPTAPSANPTAPDMSAIAALMGVLGPAGLGDLAQFVWNEHNQGIPDDQIMLDIRGTQQYKDRFPAMAALSASGHAITEGQYINLESSYTSILRAAGLPTGFYDQPDDFTKMIAGQVAPTELQNRVDMYTNLVYQLPTQVLDDMARQNGFQNFADSGWTTGDVAAMFINPDKALPVLQQKFREYQIGGAANIAGYGNLSADQEALVQGYGTTFSQAQTGFQNLAHLGQLFNPLPGSNAPGVSQDTQLQAQFGQNAAAQDEILRRQQAALATFGGGGGVAGGQQGATGAGSSR